MMPAVLDLERVYLDQAEHRFRQAIAEQPPYYTDKLNELTYLVYEALQRDKFGAGPFSVSITCNEDDFIVCVKKED